MFADRSGFTALADLRKLGIPSEKVAPVVLPDGKRPPQQLRLF